jgi:large subunit ribosomal protein L1
MPRRGKKYRQAAELVDRSRLYPPAEAVDLARKTSTTSFDATVEVHLVMGVDPRHADQQVRGVVLLPHGTGKQVRILVFAEGEAERIAREAGADYVGTDDLAQKIQDGWVDFDVAIAIPQVMGKVGRLGRVLGPRGLMPSPKTGTIVQPEELPRLIEETRLGRVEFKVDKTSNIHAPIGKVSFSSEQLLDNFTAFMEAVQRAKPSGAKGTYVKKAGIATTMGPGIKLNPSEATSLKSA